MPSSDRSLWGPNIGTADGADFEGGIGNWSNGTQAVSAVQSTEQAHKGASSLKIVRNATAAGYLAVTASDFPLAASTAYYFQCWVFSNAAAGVIKFDCDFYQANNTTYISSIAAVIPNTTLAQDAWTLLGPVAFTSPALAAFIRPIPVSVSGLANGAVLYLDEIFIGRMLVPKGQLVMPQSLNRASSR